MKIGIPGKQRLVSKEERGETSQKELVLIMISVSMAAVLGARVGMLWQCIEVSAAALICSFQCMPPGKVGLKASRDANYLVFVSSP